MTLARKTLCFYFGMSIVFGCAATRGRAPAPNVARDDTRAYPWLV